jgi:hypothetical protein
MGRSRRSGDRPRTLADDVALVFLAGAFVLLGLLWATPANSQTIDHTDVVRAAKAAAIAAGINVDQDDCSRFEVTKRAAALLASEGAGLLSKETGANCQGYATDIIAYKSGAIVDVLGSGPDGPNTVHWLIQAPVDPSRWRPPLSVSSVVPEPTPMPPPPLPSDQADLAAINSKLDQLLYSMDQLRQQQATDTEKIETRINDVVTNAKKSAAPLILKILSLGMAK